MSGVEWTAAELKKLRQLYKSKPEWTTDYEYSILIARQFERSAESVRWQLRQLHRVVTTAQPPKILLLDIETLPIEALVWDVWKQNIYMEQIRKDWSVLCWSAKWLFEPKAMGQVVTPDEAIDHEDHSVLQGVWNLLNEADVVITHNGDNFDLKKLNARFFVHGYPRPMYYQSIDTKKIADAQFSFTYAKLDWISKIVGIGRKIETEFSWWAECADGNKKYLDLMLKYNKHDVHLEEEVYLRMRPWMDKHPNMSLYGSADGKSCPACGGLNLHWKGKYATGVGLYQGFRCDDCGAIGRASKAKYKIASSDTQN